MKKYLAATLSVTLSLGFAGTVFAAEPDTSDAEYQQLKNRVAYLREELSNLKQDKEEIRKEETKDDKALKVSGDMRIKLIDQHIGKHSTITESVGFKVRYNISDDLVVQAKYDAMSDNGFGLTSRNTAGLPDFSAGDERYDDFSGSDNHALSNLFLKKRNFLGDNSLTVGRMGHNIGATKYWADSNSSGYFDGVKVSFGNEENLSIAYGNWDAVDTYDKYWNNLNASWSEKHKGLERCYLIYGKQALGDGTTLYGWMLDEVEAKERNDFKMRGIGFKRALAKDLSIAADYSKNLAQDAEGIFVRLKYKGADRAIPGSYTIGLDYERIEPGNIYATALNGVNTVSLGLRDQLGTNTFILWGEYILRRDMKIALYQSIGRKAMKDYSSDDYGSWKTGDSAPAYSRINLIWYF